MATTFARKRVELDARPVPPSPRPVPTPKTLWQAATGEPAPTAKPAPAPEPTKAEPVTRVHTPIKAAELDKEMKAAAKRIVQSDTSGGWRLVGVVNREDGRVSVYVRKHGASVRYSMTPA
ncbi:hypothetical protein [Streptomyces sp. NPDC059080]|uniref:hypothetical protein n=1 Tax=Streptomyces sp. NPDC059080 TaxID=3346718 RepID=UPI0036BE40B4